jgi:hypothetical protein
MVQRGPGATAPLVLRLSRADEELLIQTRFANYVAAAASPITVISDSTNSGSRTWNDARRLGVSLFDAVFTGQVLALFRESEAQSHLAIALAIEDPTLEFIPWDLLRDPEREPILALQRSITLCRQSPGNSISGGRPRPQRSKSSNTPGSMSILEKRL